MNVRDTIAGAIAAVLIMAVAGIFVEKSPPPANQGPVALAPGDHPLMAVRVCEAASKIIKAEPMPGSPSGATMNIDKVRVDGETWHLTWQAGALFGDYVSVERPAYVGNGPVVWAEIIGPEFGTCVSSKPIEIQIGAPHTH